MTLDRVRHVFLLLLIALSFYISYNIWVPREEGELTSTLQATNQMPAALIERKRLHVYAPAQYICIPIIQKSSRENKCLRYLRR